LSTTNDRAGSKKATSKSSALASTGIASAGTEGVVAVPAVMETEPVVPT
jgi:hypothetical protein